MNIPKMSEESNGMHGMRGTRELSVLPAIVHSGHFHADEVMAVAMLDLLGLLPDDKKIIRTRNANIISSYIGNAYILDVGQVDDPNNLQFDHHQRGFDRYFSDYALEKGVKMSSCGLLYKFLNTDIFTRYCLLVSDRANMIEDISRLDTDMMLEQFYNKYIMEIDANDNGVSQLNDAYKDEVDKNVFRYTRSWNLQGIVARFNNTNTADSGLAADAQDAAFMKAVSVCRDMFDQALYHFIIESIAKDQSLRKLRTIIDGSVGGGNYMRVDNMGVLIMDEKFDYTGAANELLYENSKISEISEIPQWVLSVLPREEGKNDPVNDQWQIHTVNIIGKSFQHRVSILTADQARDIVGDNLIFVHNARFIAVTKGREAAIRLAVASIKALERSSGCDSENPEIPKNLEKSQEERLKLGVQVFALLAVVCGTWIGIIYYNK